ncbi:MAG: fibronectin type III domain-containing protein [Bacteroidales bacterium]|nr:fibronectin type III domain-containing protein [Bacteroidales bacterium]
MDTPQESQMIYSDADLTAMRGMNISQMTFYVESSGYGSDWGSNTTTVSLAVTTATSVPTTFVSETMTTVYTGTIDVSANQLVITFDNEFAYPLTGGNLLVDFTVTSAGDYKDYLFYGISALGMSYMEDESSNYSGDFLPKVTFTYSAPANCPRPTGLAASSITSSSANLSWTAGGTESAWNLKYKVDGGEYSAPIAVNAASYSLTALLPGTTYYVAVQANCGGSDGQSTWLETHFTTGAIEGTLPFSCTFDNPGDNAYWAYLQDGQTNHWMIGAQGNSGNSLYITNDESSNAYSTGSTSYSYAYVTFNLTEAGTYNYSFDWKANGEGNWDFMRVALVPTSTTLTASTSGSSFGSGSYNASAIPTGAIVMDGGKLNLSSSWATKSGTVAVPSAGQYRLVFYWRNDNSGGSTPPANVDNVVFYLPNCRTPYNVAVSNLAPASATVSWTAGGQESNWDLKYKEEGGDYGSIIPLTDTSYNLTSLTPNTEYTVAVRANCGGSDGESTWEEFTFTTDCAYLTSFPYEYGFEGATIGSSSTTSPFAAECWTRLNNGTSSGGYPYISSTSTYCHSGTRGLYWYGSTTTGTYGDYQCVILPGVDVDNYPVNTLLLKFWAKASSASYHPVFYVGVMTDRNDINTFTPVATINVEGTDWTEHVAALDSYTGTGRYVALLALRPTSAWYAYVDDFTLDEIPSCGHVENLAVAAVTAGAARIEWNSSIFGTYTGAHVEYKLSADLDWTVAGNTTDSVYLLTGLSANTEYDVRVKALCPNNDESIYEETSLTTDEMGCAEFSLNDTTIFSNSTTSISGCICNSSWGNTAYQALWTASELTDAGLQAGPITAIDLGFTASSSYAKEFTIFIGTTSTSSFTNNTLEDPNLQQQVYGPAPHPTGTSGWQHYEFSSPFIWDGVSNLIITTFMNQPQGVSQTSSSGLKGYYTTAANKARYRYKDSQAFTLSTYNTGSGASNYNYRASIHFYQQECAVPATCAAPAVTVESMGAHTAELSWIPGASETTWKVYYKESSDANYTLAATVTDLGYTVTGLASETDYDFRVVAMCSSTDSNSADVSETTLPSCMPVTALTATNINNTGATITWTAGSANADWLNNNEVNYTLKYNVQGSSNITTVPVNGTSYVIANGAPATTYEVSVQANCGTDDGLSTIANMTFTTDPLTATLPYSCNFNSVGSYQYYWMFLQNNQHNYWMVGSDAHMGTNGGSLYITDDGEHNAYDGTTSANASCSFAFVQFNLADSGEYEYSFDWNCYGESTYDYMRVALVPVSTVLTNGNANGFGTSGVPTNAIPLDGNAKMNLSSDWTSYDGVVNLTGAQRGMYRLVFYWRNDGSVCNNPAAAVDNIVFKRLTCHKPTALATVYDTLNSSVQLSWTNNEPGASTWEVEYGTNGFAHGNGTVITVNSNPTIISGLQPNQIYDFYVRNVCGTDDLSGWSAAAHVTTACGTITALPYTATFEGNPTTGFATCWTYNGNHESLSTITSTSSYVHRGTRAMRIRQHDTITENQYAAMNAVAANLPMNGNQVTFYSRCSSGNTTVTVGVMSDPEDASTFSAIKTLNLTTAYTAYNVMLDAYNGTGRHLAFMVAPAAANYIYIDDVTLDYMPECPTPDGMLAVSTDDGIRLNWDGHKSTVDQWQIRYTWKHIDSTEAYRQVDTLIVNANERRADGSYIFENPELVTNYTFAVRNVCDAVNNEYSEWSNVADLTTDICSNMFIDTIGTTDTVSRILPVTANYNNSYTQQIVLASEIETKASISALRLLFAYTENYRYKNNVTIYMGLTEKTEFTSNTDFIPLSTMTQVYSGALNITADSWNQIIFTTPFEYTDTTKNVVIAFLDNSARSGNNQNVFAVANTGANRSIYFRSSSTINPSASNNGTRTNKRNVMQLVNCVNCSAPSNPVSLSTYTSATAQWTDNAVALGHQVYIVPANEVNAQTIENIDWENDAISAPNSNYTFANLDSATTYMWVARNVCAAGINSEALTSYVSTKKYVDLSVCDNESTGYAFAPTAAGTYAGNVQTEYQSEGVYNQMYTTVKVTVRATSSTTDVQTACDEYTWSANGMSYLASNNTDVATLTNAAGCDSVVALNLTVNYSTTGTDVQTACNTYTWIDGNAYTASNNTATYTLTNAVNCDSVVTLDLTVNYSDTTAYEAVACDTYTWPLNGHTYTSSNNSDFVTLSNQYGCDSIVVLNLTVGYSGSYIATVTACDSYEWNGNTYTASTNAPTLTLPNQYGCDSTVNLHLTVNYSTAATDVHTACDSYTWIDGNAYIASNNTATYTLTNAVNCDSLVTLDLTVKYSTFVTDAQVACDSYTWQNGTTYTASTNAPTVTYPSANGCDSVITLNLVVNYSTAATDVINACDTYTWIDGNEYTASNNTATYTLTNAVNCDSLVTLDLTVGYTSYYTDVITACLTYTWIDGNTYTASTNAPVYTFNGGNAEGCDSVVTLNLTVNPKYTVTYHANHLNVSGGMPTPSICAHETYTIIPNRYMSFGFRLTGWSLNATDTVPMFVEGDVLTMDSNIVLYGVWEEGCPDAIGVRNIATCVTYDWRGYTFTESGVYFDTVVGALYNICDSVYQLNLTIYDASATTFLANACDSYTWPLNGQTYYDLPDEPATVVYANAHGCDSVVTLNLTLRHSTAREDVVTACDTYTWPTNNVTYTTSTVAQSTITNAAGCDSVQTLRLTLGHSNTGVETVAACVSYNWYGTTYTASTNNPTHTLTNASGCDSVVSLHLTINQPSSSIVNVSSCESYTWHGTTYTASTNNPTYVMTGADVNGCDSTVHLHLTINHATTGIYTVATCDSYNWYGTTYTASTNAPTRTIAHGNSNGCDSIVNLHLTIYPSKTTVASATACETYTWNNNVYGVSGSYTQHFSTVHGCDSAVTLNLTINHAVNSYVTVQSCSSYSWHGTNYTNSGRYSYTTTAANGCDSVVTLVLTINQPTSGVETVTACGPYTWYGTTYTTSTNSATHILTGANVNGCDSTVTLHLTINAPTTGTETVVACDSYTWRDGVTYTASTNTPTYHYTNANGCDSIVTLNLTINHGTTTTDLVEACDSYTWINGKTYYASTNSPVYYSVGDNGCTNTTILDLTINYSVKVYTAESAVNSYEWHGQTYTESGEYTWVGKTAEGCDSTVVMTLYITVGIDEASALDAITVYPNPTAGQLTFSTDEVSKVEVMDLYGRKVAVFENKNVIDLSNLPAGAYTLRVTLPEGTIVRRVVKR